jgi:hypothetical protein
MNILTTLLFCFYHLRRISRCRAFYLPEDGEEYNQAGDNKYQQKDPYRQSRMVGIGFQPLFAQQISEGESKGISQCDQQQICKKVAPFTLRMAISFRRCSADRLTRE